MSKKVNIMADVEQTVYDAVVVPHKQSRTFTTLIETLLNGYYKDAYIRSFVDDSIDGIQHEANDVLNDIISNMHQGLANMGVYAEELRATSQDGMDAFSQKAEETKKEMEDIQAQEIKDIREGMDELREQVRSQNEEIMGMLKVLMASGGVAIGLDRSKEAYFDPLKVEVPKDTVKVKEEYQDAFGADEAVDLIGDGDSPLVNAVEAVTSESSTTSETDTDDYADGEEESVTSEEEAMGIMANLLEGQEYTF